MKKMTMLILFVMAFATFLPNKVVAQEVPYFTFTTDSENYFLRTQTAYTPAKEITAFEGHSFVEPNHVFVDNEDNVYISDTGLNQVIILDKTLSYQGILESEELVEVHSTFVTEDIIYAVDTSRSKIFLYDKESHELLQEIGTPDAPVFNEGYPFLPTHLAVDMRGNIYVRGSESSNGLIMLNRAGEFVTFFGANPLNVPLLDQIRSFFLTETQQQAMETVFPNIIADVSIDQKGFVYTVTSSLANGAIKKFNVAGTNYFPDNLLGEFNMESIWVGQQDSVYAVSSDGWIYEYDSQGQLLFVFGGNDVISSRFGILSRPTSIAATSENELIVVDQGAASLVKYERTRFTEAVHQAMSSYQQGEYRVSQELWEYTLNHNSVFDNARIGLGNAYLREGEAQLAYQEFMSAEFTPGISAAFWEIRQDWLSTNLNTLFVLMMVGLILWSLWRLVKKFSRRSISLTHKLQWLKKYKFVDNFLFIFEFHQAIFDGIYTIKRRKRVSVFFSMILFLLYIGLFLMYHQWTNVIFVADNPYLLYELATFIFVVLLWMVSNYLICSINDGEGTFLQSVNGTAYAMTPILFVFPVVIFLSNGLTLEQRVFFYLSQAIAGLWVLFLQFFVIKDLHNYEVGETFTIIFKSIFTMLIIGLCVFVLYTLGSQLINFILDVITEVSAR
ncbi:YIP1 family protein [Enterococcus sp.]|uniref:YIP1 family protein n=1 Tax=Enterococcus sp. TaxID=35783 RepID=UPI00289FAB77|nr:YIP1 family protein [Enterococcus sp.]